MALRASLSAQPHLYIGDVHGRPLDYGMIYFGEPNKDPEQHPINIYYDELLTVQAQQPVRTKGGFMNAFGDMVEVYAAEQSYSVKVLDAHGFAVYYKADADRVMETSLSVRADQLLISSTKNPDGRTIVTDRPSNIIDGVELGADIYLDDNLIAKKSITSDKLASDLSFGTLKLTKTSALTVDASPNMVLTESGEIKRTSGTSSILQRKVGKLEGNIPEYDAQKGLQAAHIQAGDEDAPKLAYKTITFTYNGEMNIPHGLDAAKILSVSIIIRKTGSFIPPNTSSLGFNYSYAFSTTAISLKSQGDESLKGGTGTVLIAYAI